MKADLAPGKVAVDMGCGGLGQYGIQVARLTGACVIAVDTNPAELIEARALGADECFLADETTAERVWAVGGADTVLNFAPSSRVWSMVTGMLNNLGTFVSVAMVAEPVPLVLEWLTFNGVKITGTSVGTCQEMHDFLALAKKHGIRIDVEPVALEDVNATLYRLAKGDVRGRFVIDFSKMPSLTLRVVQPLERRAAPASRSQMKLGRTNSRLPAAFNRRNIQFVEMMKEVFTPGFTALGICH